MSEITRWSKYGEMYPGDDGEMYECADGEWVRWEDVKVLIDVANDVLPIFKEYCDELRKLNDTLAR